MRNPASVDDLILLKIGKAIKKLRVENGYSSYETFAIENDLDRKQYWRIENGTNITIRTLLKILSIHKIQIADFFNDYLD